MDKNEMKRNNGLKKVIFLVNVNEGNKSEK